MTTITGLSGMVQPTPAPDPVTGLIDCNWQSSYTLEVPTTWTSGIYLARLTGDASNKQSYIIFVVRDDVRSSDLVFESSVTTFQAYNFWPGGSTGKSLYSWAPGGRAWKVSFNRPYVLGYSYTPQSPGAASGVGAGEYLTNLQPGPHTTGFPIPPAAFEYNMVRWLEANGYDVTYATSIDLHENPGLLLNHKAYLSVGHNEYWSMPMVQNLQSAMNAGVNAGFFSANTMYWQVRLEPDSQGNADRVVVCYKTDAITNDPMYSIDRLLTTVNFRSWPVNMPEAAMVGIEYVGDPVTSDIVISNASHWLLNGTGLSNGDHLQGLLGYEVDSYVPGISPGNTAVLASSPIGFPEDIDNPPGFDCQSVECNSNVTWYTGANYSVFATGTMFWSWGLDDFNAPNLRPSYLSAPAQQITKNVLSALIDSIAITTPSLPVGMAGTPYSPYTMGASGGVAPYSWSASNLPAGMSLSTAGVLSGTPLMAGTSPVAVSVSDSAGHAATISLPLVVQSSGGGGGGGGSPAITSTTPPYAVVGASFSQLLAASGGAPPYTWSIAGGALPSGLTLSSAGQVGGTANNTGVFAFTAKVTDSAAQSATAALQIVSIGAVDSWLSTSMDAGKWCACVLDQAAGSQNPQVPVQQQNGQLSIAPQAGLAGMNYNGYGSVAPIDMTDAVLSVQAVQVAVGNGSTDTTFTLAVNTQNWYRFIVEGSQLYLQSMVAGVKSGMAIPYSASAHQYWRFRHSSAAGEMYFETSDTGVSWTTQRQISAAVPVSALLIGLNAGTWGPDQNTGQAIFANLRWEQNSDPVFPYIAAQPLSSGTVGSAYTGQLSASSGTAPYSWSSVAGSLPAGLQLSSGGALAGVPTASGTFTFTVQVSDTNSLTATHVFQITVSPGTITQTYTISGQVTLSGSGLPGVAISLNGITTAITDNAGVFSLTGLSAGPYTVSAMLSGFAFSPPTQTFSNLTSNETANFTASAVAGTPQPISIDFVGSGTAMGSTEIAGVVPEPYWNNAVGNNSTAALTLYDATNAATTATLTWSADNVWGTPITDTPGNTRMMKGYLDTAHGDPITITLSNLPSSATGYDVYVYFDGDNQSGTKTMSFSLISGGITQATVVGIDAAYQNFSGTFAQANGTAGNYVKFTTGATTFSITATPEQATDSIPRAAINGLQIIPH